MPPEAAAATTNVPATLDPEANVKVFVMLPVC